ncbi:helix-turn-helix domain-containing protein [Levilactobacillus fujinensis]|uniref:Helix-turn-helix domain-containing protein n=1 Tax=Levilactobacillus fujinensis TaxID=2486024 RepID=A0ABW1TJE0_9LACO|nr:helix-turn-helix transcriptional regulator [Levilactobacillus fujinensis]
MTFGEKLQQARRDHQLTQSDVAKHVAVSRQTISSWETGKSYPDIDSLVTLSNLYGLSLDVLIKEDTGMLDYLRKPEILKRLRPIHQAMLVLNELFIVILLFFIPNQLGAWVLIAAFLANGCGFLYLQKFEEQLSPLPVAEQRWRNGWLPGILNILISTGALIITYWRPITSTAVTNNLGVLVMISWLTLLGLWSAHAIQRLKDRENATAKQKYY